METTELRVHRCKEGGSLFEFAHEELLRKGQLAIRTVPPGRIAGGHRHNLTNEWWLVIRGTATLFLEYPDGTRWMRQVSGDRPEVIDLPAGTGHNIKAHDEEVVFIFWADRIYSPETHDVEEWEW